MERKRADITQEQMEENIWKVIRMRQAQVGRMNQLLQTEFVSCNAKDQTLKLRFPTQYWQMNPAGHLHGGASAAIMDVAMGALAHIYSQGYFCITTDMSIHYLRPVSCGDYLITESKAELLGRRVMSFTARGILEKNGKTAFTASATYMVTEEKATELYASDNVPEESRTAGPEANGFAVSEDDGSEVS